MAQVRDLIEPATANDIETLSDKLGLEIRREDVETYLKFVNANLKACNQLGDAPEPTLPVKYPRVTGCKPLKEENEYRAWAHKVSIQGAETGPLVGKTVAVKDNIAVAGVPTENGSKMWQGYTPDYDATVVTRLLDAGATITGKSVCEDQCFSGSSFTSISGPVLNPCDKTRSAGGSSSGSAVLVALGEVDLALGGDQGGSVRLPSSWCGVVGLKPTHGLVPCTGAIGMEPSFDHVGPMARTVTDVALMMEAIAGWDAGRDSRQREDYKPPKYTELLSKSVNGRRFAVVTEGMSGSTDGVKQTVMATVDKLRAAGATVDEVSISAQDLAGPMFCALMASFYQHMIPGAGLNLGHTGLISRSASLFLQHSLKTQPHNMSPVMKAVSLYGEFMSCRDGNQAAARANNLRPWLRAAYDEVLSTYDALLMPTIKFVAPELPPQDCSVKQMLHDALSMTANTAPFNITGHPALSINCGYSKPADGEVELPVGLQLIGRHWQDDKLLDVASGVEKVIAGVK